MRNANPTGEPIHVDAIRIDGELYLKHTDVVNWIKEQIKELEGQDVDVLHHLLKALISAANKNKPKSNQ